MKQWTTLMDGIEGFRIQEAPEPVDLGSDEVLVKIHRVSLNNRDIKLINGDFKGRYATPSERTVPISDGSGKVVRVGDGTAAQQWKIGDRVLNIVRPSHLTGPSTAEHHAAGIGFPKPGVLTEYRVFPAAALIAVPEYMTLDEACTLAIAAVTAWMALNWDQPLGQPRTGAGVTVLLQGTGGVSIAALQQAHALGMKTIVTSSSKDKLQKAKQLGADHLVNYKETPDWAEEVLKITQGKGADIVVEVGGPDTMEQSLKAVAAGGTISAVGILTGFSSDRAQANLGMSLMGRNAALKGVNIGPKDRMEEMMRFYVANQIHPVIERSFDFEQAKDAVEYLKSANHFGKVVIKVQ